LKSNINSDQLTILKEIYEKIKSTHPMSSAIQLSLWDWNTATTLPHFTLNEIMIIDLQLANLHWWIPSL